MGRWAQVASLASAVSTARSWATSTAAMWPTTMAKNCTQAMASMDTRKKFTDQSAVPNQLEPRSNGSDSRRRKFWPPSMISSEK